MVKSAKKCSTKLICRKVYSSLYIDVVESETQQIDLGGRSKKQLFLVLVSNEGNGGH
jgi:hypothetical protein